MRTKIEYSVDLKEVPGKVKEKLLDVADELRSLAAYAEALSSDLEYDGVNSVTSRIERSRRRLYSVDNALEDCDKTIRGYAATVTQLQEQSAKSEEVENEPGEKNND